MKFITEGKIECKEKIDSLKIIENLNKILGYPPDVIDNLFSNKGWCIKKGTNQEFVFK